MSGSCGSTFPTQGFNRGHRHYHTTRGKEYLYIGGSAADESNWVEVATSGTPMKIAQLTSDPDTTGWGTTDAGRMWENTTDMQTKKWDGEKIVILG